MWLLYQVFKIVFLILVQRLLNGFRFLPVSKFCFPFTLVTLSTHYLGILFLTLTTIDPFSVYKFIKNCIS